MKKVTFRAILGRVLFIEMIVFISLFSISCKNKSANDANSPKSIGVTVFQVTPENDSLLYNVEILQDKELLIKFEAEKGKFEFETIIEIGHAVTLNAVYQEENKKNISVRISQKGEILRETSNKGGAFATAYIIK